jgi:hypothetical protein
VALAAALNFGSDWAIGVGLVALAALGIYLPWPRRPVGVRPAFALWCMTLFGAFLNLLATRQDPVWMRRPAGAGEPWILAAQVASLGVVCLYGPAGRGRLFAALAGWRFPLVVSAFAVQAVAAILGRPDPQIDVFYFLNEGVRGLAQGLNPYAMQFSALPAALSAGYQDPSYHFDVYSYLPGTLLLTLPALVLGDVRWVMLGAVLLAALGLRRLARAFGMSRSQADLPAVAFLCYPGLLHVLQSAWVEPLIVCLWIGALVSTFARPPRGILATACAGLFLAVKQYAPPLLLPLMTAGMSWRRVLLAAMAPLALSIPFFLWGPGDFYWDAFWYQVQAPMRNDALSLNAYLMNVWGSSLPGWLSLGPPLLGAAYLCLAVMRREPFAVVLTRTAGMYLLLFLFNKFAFANYYFLLEAVLLVAVAAACIPETVPDPSVGTRGPAPHETPPNLIDADGRHGQRAPVLSGAQA